MKLCVVSFSPFFLFLVIFKLMIPFGGLRAYCHRPYESSKIWLSAEEKIFEIFLTIKYISGDSITADK